MPRQVTKTIRPKLSGHHWRSRIRQANLGRWLRRNASQELDPDNPGTSATTILENKFRPLHPDGSNFVSDCVAGFRARHTAGRTLTMARIKRGTSADDQECLSGTTRILSDYLVLP